MTEDIGIADRQIVTTRTFDHPIAWVWHAWSDPTVIATWWGPDGFTSSIDRFEFHPGGAWVFTMHGPDGTDFPTEIVFDEITEEDVIRFRHLAEPQFTATAEFTADGPATTTVRYTGLFATKEQRDAIAVYAGPANEQFMTRLGAVLDAI
jgi:uncharacterized protein YndB with AHSA1/START domain